MKLNEFKAWFDGYTESMDGPPSKKQWERIKEQVKAIDGVPVTYPVYVDRYWRPSWGGPYWYSGDTYTTLTATSVGQCHNGSNLLASSNAAKDFDGVGAMYLAGKAEADHGFVHDNGV